MKLAVVGSRQGADLQHVRNFLHELWVTAGDTIVVSGGAEDVDTTAEQDWISYGGTVISFRVKRFPDYRGEEQYGVSRWELGPEGSRVVDLIHHPTFADYKSALWYRDMLIAEECDRAAGFVRPGGSRGTRNTLWFTEQHGKPAFEFEAAA